MIKKLLSRTGTYAHERRKGYKHLHTQYLVAQQSGIVLIFFCCSLFGVGTMRELNSNINTYYVFQALLQAKLFAPLIALYLTDAVDITLGQVFLLESVGLFLMTLLALPCGAFADQLGKRKALVIGASLMLVSDAALALSTTFAMVLLSFCLSAVSFSMIRGPDSALLYSTMKTLRRKCEYKNIAGKSEFYNHLSMAITSVLGGLVAAFGLRMTVFASIPISILCLTMAIRFKEPQYTGKRFSIGTSIEQITGSISYTIGHSQVLLLMTYTSIVWTAVRISYYVHQQYVNYLWLKPEACN